MNTIFLSNEEVAAYLRDLLDNLITLKEHMPMVWCPIGLSGGVIAREAMCVAGEYLESKIKHVPIDYDRTTEKISFLGEPDPKANIAGQRILLLDDTVHSGSTFWKSYQAVMELGPAEITSYSLVVRVGASILPNYFGLMIGDYDRAVFLKQAIPNNRLFSCGCVRKLADADQRRAKVVSGEDFVDKFSWGDLLYEMMTDSRRQTYVYERNGGIQAFVNFRIVPGDDVLIDALVTDKSCQGQGIAGNLMRWAETYARNHHCATVHLWAVDEKKDFYKKRGYEPCGQKRTLDDTTYHFMRKKLLYNLPDDHVHTMGA